MGSQSFKVQSFFIEPYASKSDEVGNQEEFSQRSWIIFTSVLVPIFVFSEE
ncbi:hypothetical protein [Bartonella sp. MU70NMGDW]|uniref:hypothetical protein n=1 Tax=Bartonella sp. MU70NMGDW TaxID=3243561 RepID=UPI0035D060CB